MPKKLCPVFVKQEIEKEEWILHNEYTNNSSHLIVSHPDYFEGSLCKTLWANWRHGDRPDMRSLVDKTAYVRKKIEDDGWTVHQDFEYKNNITPIHVSRPDVFDGFWCKTDWAHWSIGKRPAMYSLVYPEQYVAKKLLEKGWILKSQYKSSEKPLIIENPGLFNGFECKTTWDIWKQYESVSFSSIVDKTSYIKLILESEGLKIADESWEYVSHHKPFSVLDKYGVIYSTRWSSINQGYLPGSLKSLIFYRLSSFLKKPGKTFSLTRIFSEDYVNELKAKFPEGTPSGHHLDHIIPISWWGNSEEQVRLGNQPSNLRFIPQRENLVRGNKLTHADLDKYDLWDLFYQAENPKGYTLANYGIK